ncbi:MAG: YhdH/YhfP family quinone oxidoreductase [Planctomycetes bacterium]|nr:YhdH/YhfP family quinone oxidoreductase [Planctomycetota bacterium]
MTIESFPAFVVRKDDQGQVYSGIEQLDLDQLPDADVLVRVRYSSLNYKDALAASGHPGVVRTFPHVPGVDAAGTVVEDVTGSFSPGSEVIVTGYDLGGAHWGGYAEYIRVPVGWLVPLPAGLSLEESMILGTAGFTAAQSVQALIHHAVGPQSGPVVVTGASGGVGCLSVAILARLGYEVVAVTGKPDAHDFLRQLGAAHVIGRDEVTDDGRKPLLAERWAGGVDTVGGAVLTNLLRSTQHRGCVTACGLVAGTDLPLSVYPFILRGVTLAGIDSAQCPMAARREIWTKLAGEWKPDDLASLATRIDLSQLDEKIADILAGSIRGRVLVLPTA